MDENKNENNQYSKIYYEKDNWKKCLLMILAAFLGGFFAFYFVMDQAVNRYEKRHYNPKHFEEKIFNDIENSFKNELKEFDRMMSKHNKISALDMAMPIFIMDSVKIKTEFEDNHFNIVVDLKPFQGDENKINYNVVGRKLTVFGSSSVKDKNSEHDISFSQDFILPENADTVNIRKIKDGKKLIISIPLKEI